MLPFFIWVNFSNSILTLHMFVDSEVVSNRNNLLLMCKCRNNLTLPVCGYMGFCSAQGSSLRQALLTHWRYLLKEIEMSGTALFVFLQPVTRIIIILSVLPWHCIV